MEIKIDKLKEQMLAMQAEDDCKDGVLCSTCELTKHLISDLQINFSMWDIYVEIRRDPGLIFNLCARFLLIGIALAETEQLDKIYEKADPS